MDEKLINNLLKDFDATASESYETIKPLLENFVTSIQSDSVVEQIKKFSDLEENYFISTMEIYQNSLKTLHFLYEKSPENQRIAWYIQRYQAMVDAINNTRNVGENIIARHFEYIGETLNALDDYLRDTEETNFAYGKPLSKEVIKENLDVRLKLDIVNSVTRENVMELVDSDFSPGISSGYIDNLRDKQDEYENTFVSLVETYTSQITLLQNWQNMLPCEVWDKNQYYASRVADLIQKYKNFISKINELRYLVHNAG